VPPSVKKRSYDASRRRAAADETRRAVLRAARELFAERGYAGTSVAEVARRAGVAGDTVYSSVGRKPQLVLAVHDMVLNEGELPVPAEQRGYVQRMRAAPTAREKIAVYAEALATILPETAPLLLALRTAGETDHDCRATYDALMERRATNMRRLAADLRATRELRDDIDDDVVADLVWSMNGPEFFTLWTARGRSPDDYAALLVDAWTCTLLR
jgi:AcrR family transcriptional regulator